MFITKEILEKYAACKQGINFFVDAYPNGIELVDLLDDSSIPFEILHWGAQYLPYSDEEYKKYLKAVRVCESRNVSNSSDILRCNFVVGSKHIRDSGYIRYSDDVQDSAYIDNGIRIKLSKKIIDSNDISYCEKILHSYKCTSSTSLAHCGNIDYCFNLFNCENMKNCSGAIFCNGCINIGFSSFLTNCKNCLCCVGLNDKEYYIFNQQVTPEKFETYAKAFLNNYKNFSAHIIEDQSKDGYFYEAKCCPVKDIFKLTENGKAFMKTLPNYTNELMTQLTYDSSYLKI